MTRVLVVDDHPLFRDGLAALLRSVPGTEVVGLAADGETACRLAAEAAPDVVVMDLNMPGLPGLEAIRRLTRMDPAPAVLVLTMVDDDDSVTAALQVGARGYLLKGAVQEEVLAHGRHGLILNCARQWGESTVTAAKAVHTASTRGVPV